MKSWHVILTGILLLLISLCCLSGLFPGKAASPKVFILGIDGMDPQLLRKYLEEGILPHFQRLIDRGGFRPLQTTMPPLSPVAWSTFITGTLPSRHGVYDFLHRDPETVTPEFSMAEAIPPEWTLSFGKWVIPLESGTIRQLRKGEAFWEILAREGIPSTIYRMPVNFPPAEAGKALTGMGTPDILGTPGTFTYFTTEFDYPEVTGGRVVEVSAVDHTIETQLEGPANTFRLETRESESTGEMETYNPMMSVGVTADVDPENPVARISISGKEVVLQQGEWSDWIPISFSAIPYLVEVSASVRLYLKEVRPHFKLYVTPLQISPEAPAMPITYPDDWAEELFEAEGYFYTQELPEDTKAFSSGIFDAREFWEQSQFVYREQRSLLEHALANFEEGLTFFYFSSVDQGCHMLWRYTDPEHPAYIEDPFLADSIRTLYREMDEALGRIMEELEDDTTLIVMSDHGFSPFNWEVDLNSWLLEKGYVGLKDPSRRDGYPLFMNVDWSRTRAYALGLNGLYVNLRGREAQGIVSQGYDYEELLTRLEKDLLEMVDPRNGKHPVAYVLRTGRDYTGADAETAPDLIVGYARGYRSSWKSPLGEFPRGVFRDNLDPWSGDHSIDFREVPGILVSNRKVAFDDPALYDLTVAVLEEYGVSKADYMLGRDCLE